MVNQVQDLPEAREFQLERLLSIMSSIVAVTEAATKAANSLGSTELFVQVQYVFGKMNLFSVAASSRFLAIFGYLIYQGHTGCKIFSLRRSTFPEWWELH